VDAAAKVLGNRALHRRYRAPGHGVSKALRSRYPRARVVRIDHLPAEAHPDVVRVLTARDVPFNKPAT
jgi:CO/xanthine dehydrogenase Mo-binding subunit